VQNTSDAVNYQVDTNNDGIIGNSGDTSTSLSPVFQDLIAPTTTATLSGTITLNSTTQTGTYYDQVQINLSSIDNQNGSGIEKTYYSLNTGSTFTYTGTITLTQTGTYTFKYYSVDKFNNKETEKTKIFSILKTPQQITPTYTFPTQTIAWNSGQQTAVSSWYTIVGNIP
jgi:hypothetical protein